MAQDETFHSEKPEGESEVKGKIDHRGYLKILRGNFYKLQCCLKDKYRFCSDGCPLFGEPTRGTIGASSCKEINSESTTLNICQTTFTFDDFTDERGKK